MKDKNRDLGHTKLRVPHGYVFSKCKKQDALTSNDSVYWKFLLSRRDSMGVVRLKSEKIRKNR